MLIADCADGGASTSAHSLTAGVFPIGMVILWVLMNARVTFLVWQH